MKRIPFAPLLRAGKAAAAGAICYALIGCGGAEPTEVTPVSGGSLATTQQLPAGVTTYSGIVSAADGRQVALVLATADVRPKSDSVQVTAYAYGAGATVAEMSGVLLKSTGALHATSSNLSLDGKLAGKSVTGTATDNGGVGTFDVQADSSGASATYTGTVAYSNCTGPPNANFLNCPGSDPVSMVIRNGILSVWDRGIEYPALGAASASTWSIPAPGCQNNQYAGSLTPTQLYGAATCTSADSDGVYTVTITFALQRPEIAKTLPKPIPGAPPDTLQVPTIVTMWTQGVTLSTTANFVCATMTLDAESHTAFGELDGVTSPPQPLGRGYFLMSIFLVQPPQIIGAKTTHDSWAVTPTPGGCSTADLAAPKEKTYVGFGPISGGVDVPVSRAINGWVQAQWGFWTKPDLRDQ